MMFPKIFTKKSTSRAPDGARIYAVGDIHGCAGHLDRLLAEIRAEEKRGGPKSQLIFLGDYVDRGLESRGVIDRLIAIGAERVGTVFLKGNHEAALLDFLQHPVENADWLEWGGAETVESYGVSSGGEIVDIARALAEKIPGSHLQFFNALELWRRFGDYLFVHAGLRPGKPVEQQEERDLLWIRGDFHRTPPELRPKQVVVHGHQPLDKPLDAGWRIDVDTGACFNGRLTAVVLEGDTRRFLQV
jgi:serine/threonine protein phosphatase 1